MKIKVIDFGYTDLPNRAHSDDVGADVKACFHDKEFGIIWPHEAMRVPLGMGIRLPSGMAACVFPRSGLSSKGITCELAPIDPGYEGEIHAIVYNGTKEKFRINNGDRIGQLVVFPVVIADFEQETSDDSDSRGAAGFGSTGI